MSQSRVSPPDPAPPGTPSAQATSEPVTRRRARILIVDDDADVREMIGEMLRAIGFEPILACSGEEGLALLDRDAAFDLLLADYAMPGMNGIRLLAHVQDRHPTIATLLVTGHAELDDVAALSPEQVVRKPFGVATLRRRVEQAMVQAASGAHHLANPRQRPVGTCPNSPIGPHPA